MLHLWIGIAAGLAATPHCAGMCGGFALHLSRAAGGRPWIRQLLFLAGKTFTYAFLGALAGSFGQLLLRSRFFSSQHLLAYLLGGLMVLFGLVMLQLFPAVRLSSRSSPELGLFKQLYSHFFHSPSPWASLLLGVATGFLPCSITLAMLAGATAAHSPLLGLFIMTGLGLGTAPVLLGIGFSGTLLDTRLRRIGLRGAGIIMILLGLSVALRPTGLMRHLLPSGHHQCCGEAGPPGHGSHASH